MPPRRCGDVERRSRCGSIRTCPTIRCPTPMTVTIEPGPHAPSAGSWPSGWRPSSSLAVAVVAIVSDASSSSTGGADAAPAFVDDTAAAGIDHAYTGGIEYFVGGGVAAFDCDGNGLADLFFAGGTDPAALYRNESPIGGALRFANVASPITDLTQVTGAYPIDIDSDGLMDLAVLRRGANVLLRGLGDCGFEDATAALGLDGGDSWTAAFSATWEGSNRLPTLAFGNYLVPDTDDVRRQRARAPRARRRPVRAARWRSAPATARCRSCSATGAGPANATCGCRTTGTTTSTARSSCGGSLPTRRRVRTPRPTAGSRCRSGGWASPART